MVANNRRIVFDRRGCHIFDEHGNLLIEAQRQGRLYIARTVQKYSTKGREPNETSSCMKPSVDRWHQRMMHVSKKRILQMDCQRGKSTRQPFRRHLADEEASIASRPLDLVHCDLMGPMDTPSLGKARDVLAIIDDATRYVRVYFLRNKGSVLGVFKTWRIEAEKQSERSLKKVRTDNGLEFCSKAWEMFCLAAGIIHERAMAYTPQQNGVAERMNRTLLDLVRSTMTGCTLPRATWVELICTAAYIRNRVTNRHNEVKTPYELWFNRKPSLRHLRT
ncbi:hypothetical protein M514_27699 [Trichuris suis]|uniref:Integrase catalytic domain-containing protein n=1 Tax=Trichuris suis TaxID=68888 RepID=A0A085MSC2_9BILA|nr:hypothetical protein M514_27699 [Trichuris suis]